MEANLQTVLIIAIVVIIGLMVVGSLVLVSRLKSEIQLMRRINKVSPRRSDIGFLQSTDVKIISSKKRSSVDSLISTYIPTFDGMRRRFRQAGVRLSLGVYILILLVLTAIICFTLQEWLLLVFQRPEYMPLPVLLATHFIVNNMVLGWLINRRKNKLIEQMPLALDYITRALTVGQPIDSAIRDTTKELDPPLRDEFETIINQLGIGTTLERAIRGVASELEIKEFDFFAVATIVQIESGGSLADALRGLSDTIRQRHAMRLKVQALAAEGKASAFVLGSLPVLMLIYFRLANPEYVEPLFSDPRGRMALLFGFGLIVVGGFIMRKIVRIKI